MARCVDCHWFEHQHPAGREASNCRDLGERPSNEACNRFKDKNETEEQPLISAEALRQNLAKPNYYSSFLGIMHEIYSFLKDADNASKDIFTWMQQQGIHADMDTRRYELYIQRLADLYLLHQLCLSLGMASYVEDIVKAEAAKIFGSKNEQIRIPKLPRDGGDT